VAQPVANSTHRRLARTSDEYLRRAHEADRQARLAISTSTKAAFEELARNWRDLARQIALLAEMDCAERLRR
jgi:hypothetical protein